MAIGDHPAPDPPRPEGTWTPAQVPDLEQYKLCQAGYQYRDQLIPQEFSFMTQCFFLLFTLMVIARTADTGDQWTPRLLAAAIGVAGFIALLAYLLDMHANASCKGRLRWMMLRMERGEVTAALDSPGDLELNRVAYWHFIAQRVRRPFEERLRRNFGVPGFADIPATEFFLRAGRVMLVVWSVLAVVLVCVGKFQLR